jgi:hypothetical protein|tara:strand:+ start:133 stop:369 length:237 start_codon:yes stop_codon:yes gene_type:complete
MTKLNKPITRECRDAQLDGRPAIVSLLPNDIIRIRPKGCRYTLDIPIDAVIWQAARAKAAKAAAEKKKARQLRRLGAI